MERNAFLDMFLGKEACLVLKKLIQLPSADFSFLSIE